jgi:hypothetical protein
MGGLKDQGREGMSTMARTAMAEADTTSGMYVWLGRALSGLVVLFLLFDGAIKLVPLQVVIDTVVPLGWPADAATWRALGVVLITSALLYMPTREPRSWARS